MSSKEYIAPLLRCSRSLKIAGAALVMHLPCSLFSGPVDYITNPDSTSFEASQALVAFPTNLSSEELSHCLDFLRKHFDHTEEKLLLVRQNDLADHLLQVPTTTRATSEVLLEVIADVSADVLWREYCLQKLPLAFEQEGADEALRSRIIATLRERSSDPTISFSGTSLLGLYRLREEANIPVDEIIGRAKTILQGERFAAANKATALQIAVLMGDSPALDQARALVADVSANQQMRTSAVASIGLKGNVSDAALLQPLSLNPDLRLRYAARAALQRLSPSEKD